MGLQATPAFISQVGYQHPAELMRNLTEMIAGGRSGIARWGQFEVTGTGSSDQVQVTAGQACLIGNENASQGAYFAWSEATELLSVPAANGSNPRIDTILLRVADPQYGTITGLPRAYWEVVSGTAAGSPTVLPDSSFNVGGANYQPGAWLRVADIRRNVGDTTVVGARIYPSRLYARWAGRVIGNSTASTTGFGGLPSDAARGDRFYAQDLGRELFFNGTSWCDVPGQVIARGSRDTNSTTTTTEVGVYRISFSARQGQVYDIDTTSLLLYSSVSGDFVAARVRYTTNGVDATTSSTVLDSISGYAGASQSIAPLSTKFYAASDATVSLLLTVGRAAGTGSTGLVVNTNVPKIGISVTTCGTDPGNSGTVI